MKVDGDGRSRLVGGMIVIVVLTATVPLLPFTVAKQRAVDLIWVELYENVRRVAGIIRSSGYTFINTPSIQPLPSLMRYSFTLFNAARGGLPSGQSATSP